jgi:hypothetical protein
MDLVVELHEDRQESWQRAADPVPSQSFQQKRGSHPKRRYLNSWTGKTTSTPPVVSTICGFAVWVSIVITRGIRTNGADVL